MIYLVNRQTKMAASSLIDIVNCEVKSSNIYPSAIGLDNLFILKRLV